MNVIQHADCSEYYIHGYVYMQSTGSISDVRHLESANICGGRNYLGLALETFHGRINCISRVYLRRYITNSKKHQIQVLLYKVGYVYTYT